MATTFTPSTSYHAKFSLDSVNMQIGSVAIASGDTSGTLFAPSFTRVYHVVLPTSVVHTSAPTYSGPNATLAFTVPTATAATLTLGGVTYTAVATDQTGNAITVAYTTGGTAGAEVVSVVGNAISVQIQSGTSTITQVRTAVNAAPTAAALVTATGTSATVVTAPAGPTALTGGITGGAQGTCLIFGI